MINNDIILELKQLYIFLEQCRRMRLGEADITPTQGYLLGYLLERKGDELYATDIHGMFGISKASISAILKKLKEKGYLEMSADKKDDRRKKIILTEKAYLEERRIREALQQENARLCRGMTKQELEALDHGLKMMLLNMKSEKEMLEDSRRNRTC